MELFGIAIAALFGLGIGSFLNVVVLRLKKSETLLGRSHCPKCQHQLPWHELIPVLSYLMLRGQCSRCSKKISFQYPLVELITASMFVMLSIWFWNEPLQLGIYTVYTTILLTIFIYDLKYYLILDIFTIPGIVLAFIGGLLLDISVLNLFIGMAVGGGLFLVQYVISRGKWIGGGDIRLGVLMGLMLGWPTILVGLFVAYVIGALVAVGLMLGGKKNMKDALPFGTFLSAATVFSFIFGHDIIHWYLYELLKF